MLRGSCVLILLFALAPPARAGERDDAELALAQAAAAVQAAERADASLHAASETRMARDNLRIAEDAFGQRAWRDSAQAAEKAKLDADLATALTREQRATAARVDVEDGVRDLRLRLGLPAGGTP
jgi:hypothetical protein